MVKEHTLAGIEVMHMIRTYQLFARDGIPSSAAPFSGCMTLPIFGGQTLLALNFRQNCIGRVAVLLAARMQTT